MPFQVSVQLQPKSMVELENAQSKKRRMRLELLDEMRVTSDTYTTPADTPLDVALEVTNYLTMQHTCLVDDDMFDFWRHHTASFPMISLLIELYFSMVAAFVPVENIFQQQD